MFFLWLAISGDQYLWVLLITTLLVGSRKGKNIDEETCPECLSFLSDVFNRFKTRHRGKNKLKLQVKKSGGFHRAQWKMKVGVVRWVKGLVSVLFIYLELGWSCLSLLCPCCPAKYPQITYPKILQVTPVFAFFLSNSLQDLTQPWLLKSEFWQQ